MSTIETSILTPQQIKTRNNIAVTDTILFMSEVMPQIKQDMQKLLTGAVDKEALLARLFGANVAQQKLIEVIKELERLTTESEAAQRNASSHDEKSKIYNEYFNKKTAILNHLGGTEGEFARFRSRYGDEYAINFLKVVRDLKEISDTEIENVVSERMSSFTTEDLNAITEYWLCEQPDCFMDLLHKYPGVLSAIRIIAHKQKKDINSLFDAMDEVCSIESPIDVSVEYVARYIDAMDEQTSDILRDFLQARLQIVTSLFGMLDVLAKQNKLTHYVDADKAVVLSDDKVVAAQQVRARLHVEENLSALAELYVSFTKERLEDVEREIEESDAKDKTALYQRKVKLQLKLAILKGEDQIQLTEAADAMDMNRDVSSFTGLKPSEVSVQQRLDIAGCQDELKTYLHFAIEYSNTAAIIRLIENGANIFAQDSQKQTPLMLVFDQQNSKVILNAVLDGLEKRFDVKNNESAQQHIEALRQEINNGSVNQENVDAKFAALMGVLMAKPTKINPLRNFFSSRSRTASAPAVIPLTQSEQGLKRRSRSESDLTRFQKDVAENMKEAQSAADSRKAKRNVSLSDLGRPREMDKMSTEKPPEEIRLELIKLIDERLKSLGDITIKSSNVKINKANELRRLRSILKGQDTYDVIFIIREDGRKKLDGASYKVSNSEDSPVLPSQMKKKGDVIGRLDLASTVLNRPENRAILEQHRNEVAHKAMTKVRETFIHAIENLLGKKVEESWRESLSKTALFIETFNKLWPGSTPKRQTSAETKAIGKTSRTVDSHTLVTASGDLGVFRAAAKRIEEANPVLSKLVQSVQGIKPSRSTR